MIIFRKTLSLFIVFGSVFSCTHTPPDLQKVDEFKILLDELAEEAEDDLVKHHYESIKLVIDSEQKFDTSKVNTLEIMFDQFLNDSLANPSELKSYKQRERTMILSWISPTDGKNSHAWLRLPKDWDPEKEYPLYVQLHGYWDVAYEPINFMSYTYNVGPSTTFAFEDGYFFVPWGRGNRWYEGIAETDVWEAIEHLNKWVHIDTTRRYLTGHSMGGYGTWKIAQDSPDYWAAIGIHSGALFYKKDRYLKQEYADNLSQVPTYFVWGDKEENVLIRSNEVALDLLETANNQDTYYTTFDGGHDYNESDVEAMYEWIRTFNQQ